MSEFDRKPVTAGALQPARYFAASYAGEHVAGTEFVIGATFVSLGVGAVDVIWGLVIGNLLAVLTWALLCAPIATETRLTLYAYLEKIAGPHFLKLFSVVNGVLFCVLAGAMITVSASAIRILFGLEAQTGLIPSDFRFVLIALAVGAIVTLAAVKGFEFVAKFAEVSAPWMITMFFVGAVAILPALISATPSLSGINSGADLMTILSNSVFIDQNSGITMWHIIAFTWGANLAFHGALGDMTILRFAKDKSYGWFSALGMFIGHFAAWIAAGIMGAGAAYLLSTPLSSLDAGGVAYQALGVSGILAVVIAGWTTSNPTIYRAGLAFQSLNPKWSRERVTLVVGLTTALIACSPFVFSKLLGFLGIMAVIVAPVGAIITGEHYLFKRIGLRRYWNLAKQNKMNIPALITWVASIALAAILAKGFGMHVFFLFIPTWAAAFVLYPVLCALMGAKNVDTNMLDKIEAEDMQRRDDERDMIQSLADAPKPKSSGLSKLLLAISIVSLISIVVLAFKALKDGNLDGFRNIILYPTIAYFIASIVLVVQDHGTKT